MMDHSSSNGNLKLAKISPPFHNRYYKPSAINTPPWSKKGPECTSLKPSATLPPCKSEKKKKKIWHSPIHCQCKLFSSPFIYRIVTPETGLSWDTKEDQKYLSPPPEAYAHTTPIIRDSVVSSVKHDSNSRQQFFHQLFTNRVSSFRAQIQCCMCSRENTHAEHPNSSKQRDQQTFRRVRVTITAVKNRSITYYVCL
jgi:hypothetical protein